MKNQKGVTLIALVITIIVLLILAGVSIAMLTGQNGLLNRANSANAKTLEAEVRENVETAISAAYTAKVASNPSATPSITVAEIKQQINLTNALPADANTIVSATTAKSDADASSKNTLTYTAGSNTYTVTLTDDCMAIAKDVNGKIMIVKN